MNRIVGLIIIVLLFNKSYGQDTLPDFSLVERGNKVIVSWINPYQTVVQLNVQRSYDTLRNYRTVYSAPSPQLPQNGFSETKPPTNRVYYRIFYVLEGGAYFFSRSKLLMGDLAFRDIKSANTTATGDATGYLTVKIMDTVFSRVPASRYKSFRDSILQHTRDTLNAINDSLVIIHPYRGVISFKPSLYVFSSKDGISISLPNASTRKYTVKFFEENGSHLFDIPHVKESELILDKSNFYHSGWFLFELYEDEKLKEKNRFFLPRDF